MEITIPSCKNQIAIVVVGYNRLKSIMRLMDSLLRANYPDKPIPLVISIDCSGDVDLYKYVSNFHWPYGEKYVNIQKERLGLKKHIYQCGDLTRIFKAIVLLEDDLYVSPYFYNYVENTVDFYGEDDSIAEISLYKNETNGYAGLPFVNLQDGNDFFLMQDVSTWGQCWTEQMWIKFTEWRDNHTEEDIQAVDMPDIIKKWERAWSKYYLAYVVTTKRHILFPNISLTTNFSDAGEHGGNQNSVVQVNLLTGLKSYNFCDSSNLVAYDIYNNNETIPEWLGIPQEDICMDLYGIHPNKGKRYIISTRILPYSVIESFALNMRPIELNIKQKIKGNGIYLYDTLLSHNKQDKRKFNYSKDVMPYFLQGMRDSYLFEYCSCILKKKLIKKLSLKK